MAKNSSMIKNERRSELVKRYAAKRAELKKTMKNCSAEERLKCMMKLSKLPRNSSKVRLRSRCYVSGRPRAVYREYGVSRIAIREMASRGEVPGVVKASW